jgi:pimeloyl-ACP methyl ester carboxylesterase
VLHGFPTSSHDWHRILDRLARRHRVVVPDLLGFGLSDKPDQRYSLFEQADLVEAVAGDLGLDAVALVTHDMGDSVGGELLARSLDGTLSFGVMRRVLTNGSVYIDMAHLTDGQQLLLALPDEQLADGLGRDALVDALRGTFAPDAVVPDEDVQVGAELILRGRRRPPAAAHDPLRRGAPRARRPLDGRDRTPPVTADDRVGRPRPDRRLADGRTGAPGATGRDARAAPRHRSLPDVRIP